MTSSKPPSYFVLVAVLLGLAAACVDSPSDPVTPSAEDLRVVIAAGDDQEGLVGERLPDSLVIRVIDTSGRGIRDLTVGWVVLTHGGGEPFLATVQTDRDGNAINLWKLGTRAGEHLMEVRAILGAQPVVLVVRL
jgi:hypothetical protein